MSPWMVVSESVPGVSEVDCEAAQYFWVLHQLGKVWLMDAEGRGKWLPILYARLRIAEAPGA